MADPDNDIERRNPRQADASVAAASIQSILVYLERGKFDMSGWLSARKLTRDVVMKPEARFPLPLLHDILDHAVALTRNPAVGLAIGAEISTASMGVIGHILFNNHTLGAALKQYVRLAALVNEGLSVTLESGDGEAMLSFVYNKPRDHHAVNIDRMLMQTVARAKSYVSQQVIMTRVGFHHPRPADLAPYEASFDCELQFNEPRSYIAFEERFLDFELPQRNPYLHQALSRQVEALLARLRQRRSLAAKVRYMVTSRLSKGDFDAEAIASDLAMSRHTLYRHLKSEDMSFHDIVESARREKALQYLKKGKYSLSEIAFLLGFSELSAFSRAFKRWTGQSPGQYGKSMRSTAEQE